MKPTNKDGWYNGQADLSKLPAHIRETLTAAAPIKDFEVLAELHLFKDPRTAGLNVSNSRLRVAPYRPDEEAQKRHRPPGLQLNFIDPSGKRPLVMSIVAESKLPLFLSQIFKTCFVNGISVEEIQQILQDTAYPKQMTSENAYDLEEEDDEKAGGSGGDGYD